MGLFDKGKLKEMIKKGLKIPRSQGHLGSIPSSGTNRIKGSQVSKGTC